MKSSPAPTLPPPGNSSARPPAPTGQPLPSTKQGRGPGAAEWWSRISVPGGCRPTTWLRGPAFPPVVSAWFDHCLRLVVGGVFLAAGLLKVADPAKFAVDIGNYRLLPHETLNLVAIMLPWIEITAGSFVLAGVWLRPAALVIISLTVVFLAAIGTALARGLNIECGCFGTVGGQHAGWVNLAVDSMLLFLAVILARRSTDCPANAFFGKAGTHTSAPPCKASPKASSVLKRVSLW